MTLTNENDELDGKEGLEDIDVNNNALDHVVVSNDEKYVARRLLL